jgi:hypothetical protein
MLATFNGTWDWTAVGTLVLAVVTLAAVIVAAIALRQTRADITLSRKEVEEAHRPVVVPVIVARAPATASVRASRHTLPARPCVIEVSVLVVPVQNIGSGPALSVEASVKRLLNAEGNPWTGAVEPQTPGTVAGIGKDQLIPIEIRSHGWEERWSFELTLTYDDVAGKKWSTVGRRNAADGRYEDVTISAQEEDP